VGIEPDGWGKNLSMLLLLILDNLHWMLTKNQRAHSVVELT